MLVKSITKPLAKFSILMFIFPMAANGFSDYFNKLFKITREADNMIIRCKPNVDAKAIGEAKIQNENYLLQRLYHCIKLLDNLKIALIEDDSKAIIIPNDKLKLLPRAPVTVQLLSSPDEPSFVFDSSPFAIAQFKDVDDGIIRSLEETDTQVTIPIKYIFKPEILQHLTDYLLGSVQELQTSVVIAVHRHIQIKKNNLPNLVAVKPPFKVKCLLSNKTSHLIKSNHADQLQDFGW